MYWDWIFGLLGGLLIGMGGVTFLLLNGRVMGASGIVGGLVDGSGRGSNDERAAFVAGLILVPAAVALFWGAPDTHVTTDILVVAVAGLLVGVGTRIANGCTSGHGVCGISRGSLRGIVATVFYLLGGGLSVLIFKHILGVI